MTKKHDRTLAAIFRLPVSGDIKWRDVESLLKSLGAEVEERAGSRVAVFLSGKTAVLHRPHPSPNLDKGAVRDVRRFLESTGVKQ